MLSFTEDELRKGISEIGIIDYLIHLNHRESIDIDGIIYYFDRFDDLDDFKVFFFDDNAEQYQSWFSLIYDGIRLYLNQTSWESLGLDVL